MLIFFIWLKWIDNLDQYRDWLIKKYGLCKAWVYLLFLLKSERQRQTDTHTWKQNSYLLFHSPNTCNAWGQIRLKLEAGNLIQVSQIVDRSTAIFVVTCCLPIKNRSREENSSLGILLEDTGHTPTLIRQSWFQVHRM